MKVLKDKLFIFRTENKFHFKDFAECQEGTIDVSSRVKSYIDIYKLNTDVKHAYCLDIITPQEYFKPMLVISTFLDPQLIEECNSGKITMEALHSNGVGYVDCVGIDGCVYRLQYYEYYILEEGEASRKYKDQILSKWECENITYCVGECLQSKKK